MTESETDRIRRHQLDTPTFICRSTALRGPQLLLYSTVKYQTGDSIQLQVSVINTQPIAILIRLFLPMMLARNGPWTVYYCG